MRNKQHVGKILTTLVLLATTGVQAQTNLQDRLFNCAAIADVLQRLACFDNLARSETEAVARETEPPAVISSEQPAATPPVAPVVIRQPTTPASPPEASVAEAGSAEENQVGSFGRQQARVETMATGESALVDTITGIRQVEPTKIEVTLASGQVWRQTVGKHYLVREGDSVQITPSKWGNEFRLSVDGKRGYIQVSRLR